MLVGDVGQPVRRPSLMSRQLLGDLKEDKYLFIILHLVRITQAYIFNSIIRRLSSIFLMGLSLNCHLLRAIHLEHLPEGACDGL